ncbi:hypothetical protein Vadar_014296 [Vaccinium darrowii]|uniref:Uncharacterized protein n=1 Tax=Vaccinium darrowii TaxID=229202 RepID=A0ACB7Y0L4_9ERIC|nr:hypothetical protein Vadar_014296 [Vaccinium darrowii]
MMQSTRRSDVTNLMEDNPCAVCGNRRELHTSWTAVNPGRRFVACPNDKCMDFAWFDPPMCERSVQINLGLLRMRNNMEKELLMRKKKEKMLWIALGMS